jgi:succinate dehydrogenase / fumarate reductase flavoprotein subunit
MSESLRNDGRVWVPKEQGDRRSPEQIPHEERDYYLERRYPSFGNLVPRDVASRAAKAVCDEGRGVGSSGRAVYLDFGDAIKRDGERVISQKYGNLFDMYHEITNENPYQTPMQIYPAVHYTMGGLWVDYNLMSNLPGLFVLGEANFSDHGANRLGASALMQGLADGYFVIPYTIGGYIAANASDNISTDHPAFDDAQQAATERIDQLLAIKGQRTVNDFHRELGLILWDHCGMARNAEGLIDAKKKVRQIRDEFWQNVTVAGTAGEFNQVVERAGRVADFMEFAELMIHDAYERNESCGGHFRVEHQTEEGEARRNDDDFTYVSAWQFQGAGVDPILHKEELVFENVHLTQRSYK